ncbi:hypothetical protein GCK72_023737 [Caenorhabditis remanei]|uniref:Secreted protein n=1 Tax=Caenorhabditis remanei TaxID=31234 RepID=A0A6A5FXM3_CAERE|nr:hypothetical protein GCK72_023737 [Caenorhabditis remanei]KAF1747275.1 hypothetical protein GCK72_023737 [Caenorhabditis remanei]
MESLLISISSWCSWVSGLSVCSWGSLLSWNSSWSSLSNTARAASLWSLTLLSSRFTDHCKFADLALHVNILRFAEQEFIRKSRVNSLHVKAEKWNSNDSDQSGNSRNCDT